MAGKEALVRANRAKDDEFYTQLPDIEAELTEARADEWANEESEW